MNKLCQIKGRDDFVSLCEKHQNSFGVLKISGHSTGAGCLRCMEEDGQQYQLSLQGKTPDQFFDWVKDMGQYHVRLSHDPRLLAITSDLIGRNDPGVRALLMGLYLADVKSDKAWMYLEWYIQVMGYTGIPDSGEPVDVPVEPLG